MRGRTAQLPFSFLLPVLACLCAALAPAIRAHAQAESPQPGTTRKIDEYGKVGHCDETARLDNFAIELQNEPGTKGYLVVYVGKNDLPSWAEGIKGRAASYLVYSRGLSPERVKVVEGGYREERTTELWVVPENAPPPQPSDAVEFKLDRTKAYQWDEDSFNVEFEYDETEQAASEEAEGEAAAAEAEASADGGVSDKADEAESAEQAAWKKDVEKYSIEVVAHGLIEDEPQPEEPNADQTEAEESTADQTKAEAGAADDAAAKPDDQPSYGRIKVSLWWNVERLAEELKAVPDARICVVYYWGLKNATRERVREIVGRAVTKTEEQLGVKRDHITLIDGGHSYDPGVELWVVPPGAQAPKPRPEQKRNFGFYSAPGEE
jgi:hypothetical protein